MRIVFLLGAGFSMPYIKVGTHELTCNLFCESKWRDIIYDFKNLNNKSDDYTFDVDFLLEILYKIRYLLSQLHHTYYNFEYVIHTLDRLGAYFHDEESVGHIDNVALHILCEGKVKKIVEDAEKNILTQLEKECSFYIPEPKRKAWFIIPYLARELIVRILLCSWYGFCLEDLNNIRSFFKHLIDSKCRIQIYTLNYDPIIWEALKELLDFVSTGFISNNSTFNPLHFFKEQPIILAFLHGFVGFIPKNGSCSIAENWNSAHKKRLSEASIESQEVEIHDASAKFVHYNTFLTTGLDKTEIFARQPFSSYYIRFALDVSKANYLVIVGYRGLDPHINAIIKNFLISGENKKIIIVTMKEKNTLEKLLKGISFGVTSEINNEFSNLLGKVFNFKWNHIWIYPKGTEKFITTQNVEILVNNFHLLTPGQHYEDFLNFKKLWLELN